MRGPSVLQARSMGLAVRTTCVAYGFLEIGGFRKRCDIDASLFTPGTVARTLWLCGMRCNGGGVLFSFSLNVLMTEGVPAPEPGFDIWSA